MLRLQYRKSKSAIRKASELRYYCNGILRRRCAKWAKGIGEIAVMHIAQLLHFVLH